MNNLIWKLKKRLGLINEFTDEGLRVRYQEQFRISVGRHSYGCFDQTRIDPNVTIGRYCSFSPTARIFRRNHGVSFLGLTPYFYNSRLGMIERDTIEYAPLVVEDDVWFGHNAVILPSVTYIGRGAVIAAGAIVSHDVRPYAVVAGNPAKELRRRFDAHLIARIEQTRWWTLEPADLKRLYEILPEAVLQPSLSSLDALFPEHFA